MTSIIWLINCRVDNSDVEDDGDFLDFLNLMFQFAQAMLNEQDYILK